MKRKPQVKLKLVDSSRNDAPAGRRDPRSLINLDNYAFLMLCTVLIGAPLLAGDFATSTAILPISSTWSLFTAAGAPILLILVAIACVPFIWREWIKPVTIGATPGLAFGVTMLVTWAALSVLHTPAAYLSVNCLSALCAATITAGIAGRLARDRNALITFVICISVAGTVVSAIAVSEYIQFVLLHAPQHRSFSTFSDPNFLAGYLLITLPISLGLLAAASDSRLRFYCAMAVVVQSSGLWLSGSRAGSAIVFVELAVLPILALYAGAARGTAARRMLLVGLGLFVLGSLPALTPLASRLASHASAHATQHTAAAPTSSDAQTNSNEFRRWTWIGTVRMAAANPVLGTGIGGFALSYPRYAETAYTMHAHNSYLQLMSEAGYPAVMFLLIALAAAAAFAVHALVMQHRQAASSEPATEGQYHSLIESPTTLLAGLLAALVGSMLHNLLDSDWYVVATLLTTAVGVSIAVALARDLAPLSAWRPAPLRKELLAGCGMLALLLLWRGGELTISRTNETMAATDIELAFARRYAGSQQDSLAAMTRAAESYRAAASADPLDPEPQLGLAEVAVTSEERLRDLKAALAVCPTGKAYYRLGQYYESASEWAPACDAFEHARRLEPKMLQNLHALASAYLAAGKTSDAEATLESMTRLEDTPYGKVRAVHESVETDFAFAHAMRGDIAAGSGDWQSAAQQYGKASDVLAEYWRGRNYLVNLQSRTEAKRKELADLYESVLNQLQISCTHLNRTQDAAGASATLTTVKNDRAADAAQERGERSDE